MYYEVEWLGDRVLNQQLDAHEVFEWVPRDDVHELDLNPSFIRDHITSPRPSLELVIHRDGEQSASADARTSRR